MPSLKVLNHRWLVGGDEIQLAALGAIPIRILQGLVAFGVIFGNASDCFREFDDCKYGSSLFGDDMGERYLCFYTSCL